MCDPVTLGVMAVSAGVSAYGANQSANAQKKAANAVADQNVATQAAQAQGFADRMKATSAQTEAQKSAFQSTLGDETNIADAMRASQRGALKQQQDTLGALNTQEEGLRGAGYAAADDLMGRTSGANMGQSQTDWQDQARTLLDASGVPAFGTSEQTANDPEVNAALARRAAEAATNIRGYGAKASKLASYTAPLQLVQNAVQDTATGIMPAQVASKLLQSSSPVLLAPAETAWGNAQNYGSAAMSAAQQSGQAAQNIAGLQYQDSTDIANLNQSNRTVTAANIAEQAKADAAYQEAMGGVISNIGNMGLQGAGYYGTVPSFLKPKVPTTMGGGLPFG